MIKAVAVDVDGTFLSDKGFPIKGQNRSYDRQRFQHIYYKMRQMGAHFIIASGDQYEYLRTLIPDEADDAAFVADNGGLVVDQNQEVACAEFTPGIPEQVGRLVESLPGVCYTYCGENGWFIPEDQPAEFKENMKNYSVRRQLIRSVDEIKGRIFKLALVVPSEKTFEYQQIIQQRFGNDVYPTVSGNGAIDLIVPGIDKAAGLKKLLMRWHLKPEELMVFGDGENDITMMHLASQAYAMANAPENVKQEADHIAPSNNEQGVLQVMAREFGVN
ncbi:Cof-type HAD-IIB family hydrolase [Limosilactobacillus difficilis]|uniref:Cof-type HAD-IIB family hydrolase n=1 Tax=Limosilactobacillus difficilis TaxID=2991838 RepID=UPI0024B8F41D|nr:Cof-type HAD-IIB family hydrolase [Limosilactobacillus difficilis]